MNDKEKYVRSLFSSIAPTYDLLNTILSFNQDKRWRKRVVREADIQPASYVLDVCTGTGKLAYAFSTQSPAKLIIGLDFCYEMLAIAKKATQCQQIPNSEPRNRVSFIQADALEIPFQDNTFDCVTIAFGLRNISDLAKLFNEIRRVTKPGGKIVALELTRPKNRVIYLFYYVYLHWYLPTLGRVISKDKTAYSYLAKTIQEFYDHKQVSQILIDSGWNKVRYRSVTAGITTIYLGVK
ncbi:MAG: bifunctional demethylmenaquinone methyltransferase/2-methoxy-6-polyprenyl-1,4-benzoquinol methylase UbiE [bacterium]|nr:bifunctional demethylmenaquinone methyltransferase/2-methoxy-6-polyprenyl-1,4-benzoquinol methylase UbiE [bacterium]